MTRNLMVSTTNDERGYAQREISLEDDGSVVIRGHDLGAGVSNSFGSGSTEYEFLRTIRPPAVAKLMGIIGADSGTILDDLRHRFASTSALEAFLAEHGIESDFWSRVGD